MAVSCPDRKIAVGLTTIRHEGSHALRPSLKRMKEIIKEYGVTCIVLGFPKNMDGSLGYRCDITLAFKGKLERYFKSIPVELWDERLSTKAVSRAFGLSLRDEKYKQHVDEMAAVYILQGYLDAKNRAPFETRRT